MPERQLALPVLEGAGGLHASVHDERLLSPLGADHADRLVDSLEEVEDIGVGERIADLLPRPESLILVVPEDGEEVAVPCPSPVRE